MKAAVRELQAHTVGLKAPEFCRVFEEKRPDEYWELIDGLAYLVLAEEVMFGKFPTTGDRNTRLAELTIRWMWEHGVP